jgi:hypothetical protein
VLADADSGLDLGHAVAPLRDLLDRFDFTFFRVWLFACHGTFYWASGLRLEGVWKTWSDSSSLFIMCSLTGGFVPIISAADLKHQVISGNVKAITLDTSTVESFKFGFEVGVLAKMEQFSKTDADHLVLDIVLHEIRTHLTSQAELDYAHVKNALKTLGNSWGVDKAERDNALASIFHNQTAAQATSERLEAFLSGSAAVQISCGDYADIKKILPLYYAGRPPFGAKEAKKREFPDAVALLALEAWAEEKSTKVVAVSSDGDWKSYCANSPNIFLIEELSTALSAFQGDADDAAETFRSLLKAGDVVDLVDTIYDELTTEVDRIDIDFEV